MAHRSECIFLVNVLIELFAVHQRPVHIVQLSLVLWEQAHTKGGGNHNVRPLGYLMCKHLLRLLFEGYPLRSLPGLLVVLKVIFVLTVARSNLT